jgi:hypothetical protein
LIKLWKYRRLDKLYGNHMIEHNNKNVEWLGKLDWNW